MNQINKEYSVLDVINISKTFIGYLLRKWITIGAVVLGFALAGIAYAWLQRPIYKASLSFVTDSEGGSTIGTYAGIAAQFGLDIGNGSNAFEGDNLIELLKSRNLIETTLLTPVHDDSGELMINYYIRSNEIDKGWKNKPQLKKISFTTDGTEEANRLRDSVLFVVYDNIVNSQLKIEKRDKKLDLIDIQISNRDEVFAKRFVELLADNAIKYYTNYKVKRSRQNVSILQKQTDSVKSMLYGNISDFATQTDLNVNVVRQAVRTGTRRKQVDMEVNSKLYEELLKNLELSKLALRKQTPLIQIIDAPKYPLEKKKLGRLRGAIIFGFIGGFLVILVLATKYWFSHIKDESKTIITKIIRTGT